MKNGPKTGFLWVKYRPNLLKINTKIMKIHLVGTKIHKPKNFKFERTEKEKFGQTPYLN